MAVWQQIFQRYYSLDYYLKNTFGEKITIINATIQTIKTVFDLELFFDEPLLLVFNIVELLFIVLKLLFKLSFSEAVSASFKILLLYICLC